MWPMRRRRTRLGSTVTPQRSHVTSRWRGPSYLPQRQHRSRTGPKMRSQNRPPGSGRPERVLKVVGWVTSPEDQSRTSWGPARPRRTAAMAFPRAEVVLPSPITLLFVPHYTLVGGRTLSRQAFRTFYTAAQDKHYRKNLAGGGQARVPRNAFGVEPLLILWCLPRRNRLPALTTHGVD